MPMHCQSDLLGCHLPGVLPEQGDHRVVRVDALGDGRGARLGGLVPAPVVAAIRTVLPPTPSSATTSIAAYEF